MSESKLEQIGVVYVDAGIVMVGDPCYWMSDDASHRTDVARDWSKFCDVLSDGGPREGVEPLGEGLGLVVSSGYGDGAYPVYVERYEDPVFGGKRVKRLVVEFISDGDDEDWVD